MNWFWIAVAVYFSWQAHRLVQAVHRVASELYLRRKGEPVDEDGEE